MSKKKKSPPAVPAATPAANPADEEFDILICARTKDSADVLKGSIWDKCRECGAAVWISLSGQRAMKNNAKLVPFCIECAYHKHKDTKDMEVQAAPGSLQELQRYLAARKKH